MHNRMAPSGQNRKLTRLSTIHPYPAMIADELAIALAEKYVVPGAKVLDPFSGTGRTLTAAAALGADCVGMDVNPLAVLIARAKIATASPDVEALMRRSRQFRGKSFAYLEFEHGRKISWFSNSVRTELTEIVNWLNSESLNRETRNFLAAIVSATTREVSYCRKDQWKLHRMSLESRSKHNGSAWEVYERRLRRAAGDISRGGMQLGSMRDYLGDCTRMADLRRCAKNQTFNLLITSPPYGDSRSTVSYGDVSSLCLGVLQHLTGLNISFFSASNLDRRCLGGREQAKVSELEDIGQYWAGGSLNPARKRVSSFLSDMSKACTQTNRLMDKGARAIFVVSRRKVGGRRLYLDRFLSKEMSKLGFGLEGVEKRKLEGKNTPLIINSGGSVNVNIPTPTMREEIILCFSRS